jgi:serine protease DegQ
VWLAGRVDSGCRRAKGADQLDERARTVPEERPHAIDPHVAASRSGPENRASVIKGGRNSYLRARAPRLRPRARGTGTYPRTPAPVRMATLSRRPAVPFRMSRALRVLVFVLQFATIGLAIAFLVTRLFPGQFNGAPADPAVAAANSPRSYARAVERASPSVVNIYTFRSVRDPAYPIFSDPLFQRRGLRPRQRVESNLGSGVIVRPDGHILTNFHVVVGADNILVGLWDDRLTPARVVGADRDSDLAVLKIDGANLPAAALPPDKALETGDVVLAIGNSVGLGHTVTMGIVSATGRNQPDYARYEDFIQTDAAINRGNSGGALVNAEGQLVGINSASLGQNSGVQGIGFAIPAASAIKVLDQIVSHGYVIRGWTGAEYSDTAPSAAPTSAPRGVLLMLVVPGGPADRAGLKPGDVLLRFDGKPIESESELRGREASLAPGTVVRIEGERAGVPFDVELTLIQRDVQAPRRG